MLRYITGGESHGPALTGIIEGLPAGLHIDVQAINADLAARQCGYGRGGRMVIERDQVRILSGLRGGCTLGSPLSFIIENRDYANWIEYMNPVGTVSSARAVTAPRPGHADAAGVQKYDFDDVRNVLERASARETATRVVIGSICAQLLANFGIEVVCQVIAIGQVSAATQAQSQSEYVDIRRSPVFMYDENAEVAAMAAIDAAKRAGQSLGGIIEIAAFGVPSGLGSYVHWDRKLDSRLAGALMSVQAIKGVEVGGGFALARLPGAEVHDEINKDARGKLTRVTNNAGGVEGGMSNGETILLRCAMKPIPTLAVPLGTVDIVTGLAARASTERSDVCAVPAAAVVCAAVAATVICEEFVRVYGADSFAEMGRRWKSSR